MQVAVRLEAALWQCYASLYDGLLEVFAYQDMITDVSRAAKAADCEVLDACAGTGNVSAALLRAGAKRVVLVDSSANMLARARRKLARDIEAGRAEVLEDDVVAVMATLPDASVDRISAVNCLYALPNRPDFFAQAARILRPDGFVVASHTTGPGSGPIVREQLARGGPRAILRPRLIGIALVDLAIDALAHQGRYDFAAVETLTQEAAAAGLPGTDVLGRTYGGPQDGINVLLTFSPTTSTAPQGTTKPGLCGTRS